MFFCTSVTLAGDGSTVLGYQYSSIELFVSGVPPTTLAAAQTLCKSVNASFDAVNGAFTYSSDVNTLTSLFDTYFAFDPALFVQVVGAVLIVYAIGLGAGAVAKLLGWV